MEQEQSVTDILKSAELKTVPKKDPVEGKKVQVTLYTTPERKKKLDIYCAENGISRTHWLCDAIDAIK